MSEYTFFRDIGLATLGAALMALSAFLLRVPLILAYLGAGVLLGPHLGFGVIHDLRSIATISHLGLMMLMFILGLEIDVRKVFGSGKLIIVAGVVQVFGCFALGYLLFNGRGYEGIYLAVGLALSSTLIVVKLLSERMQLNTFQSRITLGILIVQDLCAVAFLAIQKDLTKLTAMPFLISIGKALIVLFASGACARWILPTFFRKVSINSELMLLSGLAWLFLVVGASDYLGVSKEMGALIAGVVIASFPYHSEVASKLSSLRDFFVTLFFVTLGLRIRPPSPDTFKLVIEILGMIYITRVVTLFPVIHWFKYGNRSALITSINLSQFSEFSIVIGALGVRYGHVSQSTLTAFILAFVVTSLLSTVLIPASHTIYQAVKPFLEKIGIRDRLQHDEERRGTKSALNQAVEVILLGCFREGSSFLWEMLEKDPDWVKKSWLVVDLNVETHRKLHEIGVRCVYGDISHFDTLKSLPLKEAKWIVCPITDNSLKGTTNLKLLRFLKQYSQYSKDTHVIVTSETIETAQEMYASGADYVLLTRIASAKQLSDVFERATAGELEALRLREMDILKIRQEVIP